MNNTLIITPETKILELLVNYPLLEDVLIEITPVFKKLKNPILRKTIAKVTSLKQAAIVGNTKLDEIINRLRKEVGQDKIMIENIQQGNPLDVPSWFQQENVKASLDAIPIINGGGHPLDAVVKAVREMNEESIFELITPFVPAPLIDKVEQLGFHSWTTSAEGGIFKTYFKKK
jgi:hypothetical protein